MTPNKLPPLPEKFRKRPVVIEAMGPLSTDNFLEIGAWCGAKAMVAGSLDIQTLESHIAPLRASPGDWIIKGVQGEFYPCKPDIFAATYEPAEALRQSQSPPELADVIAEMLKFSSVLSDDEGIAPEVVREWASALQAISLRQSQSLPAGAVADVLAELERATRKFPTWPTDPLHAVVVLGEEFGELTKAVLERLRRTPVVDDDFPEMMHRFDGALREARADLDALQADAREKGEAVVTEAMVEASARVVCEVTGETWDHIGSFAQDILKDTQRKALTAALATQPAQASEAVEVERWQTAYNEAIALKGRAFAEADRLREALSDLLSWFSDAPSPPEWRLLAGTHGADDAITAARAAIASSQHGESKP